MFFQIMAASSALSISLIAVCYVIRAILEKREYNQKKAIDYMAGLVEEGIAFSEEKNKFLKREAANNAVKSLQKEPVNITKDQVAVDKFLNTCMIPMREMAHTTAKEYIIKAVSELSDNKIKKSAEKMINSSLDMAIKMRICGAKMGINDPIRPLLYRSSI